MNRPTTTTAAALILALASASSLLAGPLDPPAGPIAPTAKPLAELEPRTAINATNTPGDANSLFRITQPGSYYLTASVAGVAGASGITITANNVTIDLNGFTLQGVPGSLIGIAATGAARTVNLRNGVINDWLTGADLANGTLGTGARVDSVYFARNQTGGLRLNRSSVVSNCVFENSSANGCEASDQAVITDCVARGNIAFGFSVGNGSSVSRCVGSFNTQGGFLGADATSFVDCVARSNTVAGITVANASTIRGCTVSDNGGTGINGAADVSVIDCTVRNSGATGIAVSSASTIRGCSVERSFAAGISVGSECIVAHNDVARSGFDPGDGANILVSGDRNRIEGNHCSWADRGIHVIGSYNLLSRNTCTANAVNWNVGTSNVCFVVNANLSAPFTGFSGGTSTNVSDPNANYSY